MLGGLFYDLAGSMNLWRDALIMALAVIVIGALYLYATVIDG